jgi:hypothetical protein
MAITDKEIKAYWRNYDLFIILWNLVSFFGFPFIPLAYILKYWFGIKGLWLLNDTKDGDFGDPKELKKADRKIGKTWGNFWWWWFRNHSFNFNRKYIPNWNAGKAEDFRVIKSNISKHNRWTWCSQNGVHGYHYIAARINGKVECRFSEASPEFQRQMGSGGNEYRFRFKGIWHILKNQISRMF